MRKKTKFIAVGGITAALTVVLCTVGALSVAGRFVSAAFCGILLLLVKRYLSGKLAGGSRLYLMRRDGEAVGVVSVTGSLIEDLYILPRYQNRGLGTALLRHAMKRCDGTPTLWILENNAGAERLYRREGFVPTERRKAVARGLDELEFEWCDDD